MSAGHPWEELRPGVGSQVTDQAKQHPPPGGGGQDREGAQLEKDKQRRVLGAALTPRPPTLLLERGDRGSPSPHHVPLGSSPSEGWLGASSVSRHSFSGADCSFPGEHSAAMQLGVRCGGKRRERWGSLTQTWTLEHL